MHYCVRHASVTLGATLVGGLHCLMTQPASPSLGPPLFFKLLNKCLTSFSLGRPLCRHHLLGPLHRSLPAGLLHAAAAGGQGAVQAILARGVPVLPAANRCCSPDTAPEMRCVLCVDATTYSVMSFHLPAAAGSGLVGGSQEAFSGSSLAPGAPGKAPPCLPASLPACLLFRGCCGIKPASCYWGAPSCALVDMSSVACTALS
jgi:hypothetical protein